MYLKPILVGIGVAHELNISQIEDLVQRLGGRRVVPTLLQTISLFNALEFIDPINPVPLAFKCAVLILPSLVTYGAHTLGDKRLCFIHDHLHTVAILAVSVSSVALIILGHTALGGSTLGLLLIGSLSRNRILPYPVRSTLDKGAFLIAQVPQFFIGSLFKKVYAVAEITLNLLDHLPSKRDAKPEPVDLNRTFTLDEVEICDYHLQEEVPDIVAGECSYAIKGSEPKSYEVLKKKLAHIKRTDLDNTGYSGALIWQVDAIYAESQDKVLYALQKARDEIFEEAIDKYFTPKKAYPILNHPWLSLVEWLMSDFFTPKDKHNYYLYINILAPNFGLTHTHGAETDQMAMSEMVYEPFMRWWNKKAIIEIKQKYSKQLIYDKAKEQMEANANVIAHLVNRGVFKVR